MKLNMLLPVIIAGTIASCSGTKEISEEVRDETREKRKYGILLSAEGQGYVLNLREKNFFDYSGKAAGESGSNLYAGSYERKGDSLFLAFYNNYKPNDLTGIGIFKQANILWLLSKDSSKHRQLSVKN